MNSQKVFISGSIAVKQLDSQVIDSLKRMMNNNLQILVGDAKGVDSQIQDFFKRNNYHNVVVYTIENNPRYLATNFFSLKKIDISDKIKSGREMQSQKDIAMTEDSDYSLIVWDGKSKGSYANILRFLEQKKGMKVFLTNNNSFMPSEKLNENEITFIYHENNGYTAQEVISILKDDGKEFFKSSRDLNSFLINKRVIQKQDNIYLPLSNHELFIVENYKGKIAGIKFNNRFIDWILDIFRIDNPQYQQEPLF